MLSFVVARLFRGEGFLYWCSTAPRLKTRATTIGPNAEVGLFDNYAEEFLFPDADFK
jgi:hypothetical protein